MPLKTRQVNIRTKLELKFANIGVYWDDATVDMVAEFLHEYQDLFSINFSDLKGIICDLGVMKIMMKPDAKLVIFHRSLNFLGLSHPKNLRVLLHHFVSLFSFLIHMHL